MMKQSTGTQKTNDPFVQIVISNMSEEMQQLRFTCGETSCYDLAQYELKVQCPTADIVLPICFEHKVIYEVWLEKDAHPDSL